MRGRFVFRVMFASCVGFGPSREEKANVFFFSFLPVFVLDVSPKAFHKVVQDLKIQSRKLQWVQSFEVECQASSENLKLFGFGVHQRR